MLQDSRKQKDTKQLPDQEPAKIIPRENLMQLKIEQIKPNPNNPRRLFDDEPLSRLKESIRTHGVLVPIIVYQLSGQDVYAIVDGERRYRCCVDLRKEGIEQSIPANIVDTPDKMSSLIYMFNIHAFREQWELMPTALSLQNLMNELKEEDNAKLNEITGLSTPQIERCKIILSFPEKFQYLSLAADPTQRIPSNFWVELYPFIQVIPSIVADLYKKLGRDNITQRMADKYNTGSIRSVIHFRRILEAIEISKTAEEKSAVADRIREYILTPDLETRAAFDEFIGDTRKVRRVVQACEKFIQDVKKSKVDYTIEGRDNILAKLLEVIEFAQALLDILQGEEPLEEGVTLNELIS